MVLCVTCNLEMTDKDTKSCGQKKSYEFADGQTLSAIPYNNEFFNNPADEIYHRCHDCGVSLGGFHHMNCDMERCPRCGGQFFMCGCKVTEIIIED